mmetsp:Transcript_148352/g.476369  ORF Transcript_148352/g.476369 Transcript_148352/m.476369 type:complete len:386 (+) Transcript_148352:1568-2725(+)
MPERVKVRPTQRQPGARHRSPRGAVQEAEFLRRPLGACAQTFAHGRIHAPVQEVQQAVVADARPVKGQGLHAPTHRLQGHLGGRRAPQGHDGDPVLARCLKPSTSHLLQLLRRKRQGRGRRRPGGQHLKGLVRGAVQGRFEGRQPSKALQAPVRLVCAGLDLRHVRKTHGLDWASNHPIQGHQNRLAVGRRGSAILPNMMRPCQVVDHHVGIPIDHSRACGRPLEVDDEEQACMLAIPRDDLGVQLRHLVQLIRGGDGAHKQDRVLAGLQVLKPDDAPLVPLPHARTARVVMVEGVVVAPVRRHAGAWHRNLLDKVEEAFEVLPHELQEAAAAGPHPIKRQRHGSPADVLEGQFGTAEATERHQLDVLGAAVGLGLAVRQQVQQV